MKPATASRPIEQFDTQVTLPEWQLEPDEESYFGQPDNGQMAVDADGNPIAQDGVPVPTDSQTGDTLARPDADQPETPAPPAAPPQQMNQDWIDRVTGRERREPSPAGRQPLQRDVPRDQVQTQRFQSDRDQEDRPNQ
jgi:penicillin-binding protein 1A